MVDLGKTPDPQDANAAPIVLSHIRFVAIPIVSVYTGLM